MTQDPNAAAGNTALPVWRSVLSVALALLILRYAVLMLTGLTLHGDEAQYWTWSKDLDFGYYSKPPLIAWIIGASTAICGDGEACVRAPSALLHIGTACFLTGLARALFGDRVAIWTGIAWLTLPAVSFSSLIMSTDVPLLFFWSGALFSYVWLLRTPGVKPAAALMLCFGLGLNAKYAMAYFLLCILIHAASGPAARGALRPALRWLIPALVAGAAMLIPNILWNRAHGWATVGHTADNAHWQGIILHFDKMGDFLGAQFGVFGPIFFLVLLAVLPWALWRKMRLSDNFRLLLAFSLPILAIITVQAVLSRANANWAATAYPAATVLVVAGLLHCRRTQILLKGSVGLHLVLAGLLYAAVLMPTWTAHMMKKDPFSDLADWQNVKISVETIADETGIKTILMDNRLTIASLAYALRDRPDLHIRAWNHDAKIDHHYEMAWLYNPAQDGERAILVTPHGVEPFEAAFRVVLPLRDIARIDRAGRVHPIAIRVLEDPK